MVQDFIEYHSYHVTTEWPKQSDKQEKFMLQLKNNDDVIEVLALS